MEFTPEIISSIIIPIIIAVFGTVKWIFAKKKLSQIATLVLDVDTALKDNQVSEDEFRKIFNDFLEVTKKS